MAVLISGAKGTTGPQVLRRVHSEGVPVRAMSRNGESAERLRAAGAEAAVADLADRQREAGHGGPGERCRRHSQPVHSGGSPSTRGTSPARRMTPGSSSAGFTLRPSVPSRVSGIAWTTVRPNGFMQNTLAWAAQIPTGTIYDARWAVVDARASAWSPWPGPRRPCLASRLRSSRSCWDATSPRGRSRWSRPSSRCSARACPHRPSSGSASSGASAPTGWPRA